MKPSVVTRFPPSPTGLLQAGNVRTAIFNYLFAKQKGGKFIVRIEDTDKERSKKEYEDNIVSTLEWLGFTHDGYSRQSENLPRHQEILASLIANGFAYVSQEEVKEAGQRSEVIRFKNPNTTVMFDDLIRGTITFDTTELGDFIIARSVEEPLYHLGVAIDDMDSGVTHVIRGEDHISNTPRQILIQRAIGQNTPPIYAHLPLLLGADKAKLSKRRGAKAISQYKQEGYLPEAVINYLALLGWHPTDDQELFTLDELIKTFDLSRVQKGGAVFDEIKLKWFNHEYLKKLSDSDFLQKLTEYMNVGPLPEYVPKVVSLIRDRAQTLDDALQAIESGEFSFMDDEILYPAELLTQGAKVDASAARTNLEKVLELIKDADAAEFTTEKVKDLVFPYATEQGRAGVLWPMRVALSGREKSPDPFTLSALLGKQKTLARIEKAIKML
jgi:glutamyl-tRNA synthetase